MTNIERLVALRIELQHLESARHAASKVGDERIVINLTFRIATIHGEIARVQNREVKRILDKIHALQIVAK